MVAIVTPESVDLDQVNRLLIRLKQVIVVLHPLFRWAEAAIESTGPLLEFAQFMDIEIQIGVLFVNLMLERVQLGDAELKVIGVSKNLGSWIGLLTTDCRASQSFPTYEPSSLPIIHSRALVWST